MTFDNDEKRVDQRDFASLPGFETPSVSGDGVTGRMVPLDDTLERTRVAHHAAPKKKRKGVKVALVVAGIIIVFAAAIVSIEALFNAGRVHQGVTVGGISVGGMSIEEATAELDARLNETIEGADITVVPDETVIARLSGTTSDSTADLSEEEIAALETAVEEGNEDSAAVATASSTWSVSADMVGVSVDTASLVQEAYNVGRGDLKDFLSQRLSAWFGGIDIPVELNYSDEELETTEKTINDVVMIPMVNYDVAVDEDGAVSLVEGSEGEHIDAAAFKTALSAAFLAGGESTVTVPLAVDPIDIDQQEAEAVADTIRAALADPVTLSYEGDSWEATGAQMGSWIKTRVDGVDEAAVLVPYVDEEAAILGVQGIMGDVGYGNAQDATFDVSSGTPVIVGGGEGEGPDIKAGVEELDTILFSGGDRSIAFTMGTVQPEVTYADAEAMGIVELITTYKLGYGSGGSSNREFNIERALSTLNGSLIAPGSNWDWNEIVGYCSYDNGYKGAGAISNGELVTEEGGGICNVATGVFNAAYEAGLPILERSNHSQYMSNYPLGRDAAVSWKQPNLVFQNDMDHYILVTATWDGYNMWISIWGTSESRTVTSENSGWSYTSSGGKSITNYREVFDADGNLLLSDTFRSTFRASTSSSSTSSTSSTTETTTETPAEDTTTTEDTGTETEAA